jgi:hypothetical protein
MDIAVLEEKLGRISDPQAAMGQLEAQNGKIRHSCGKRVGRGARNCPLLGWLAFF